MNDDIKRRIASVKQTRQITGAMETVSVAKMRKSSERVERYGAYFDILEKAMSAVIAGGGAETGKYRSLPANGRPLVIVVSSDKGLCGGFNHDVFDRADDIIDAETVIMPIGQAAYVRYKSARCVDDRFVSYLSAPDCVRTENIVSALTDAYGKEIKSVELVYTRLVSLAGYEVRAQKLLPIDPQTLERNTAETGRAEYMSFDPSPTEVFDRLSAMYLNSVIYGAIVHSAASEHCARRAAMSTATKSADEMIVKLSAEYNRARQSDVTGQITEIIGAMKAIGKGERS